MESPENFIPPPEMDEVTFVRLHSIELTWRCTKNTLRFTPIHFAATIPGHTPGRLAVDSHAEVCVACRMPRAWRETGTT